MPLELMNISVAKWTTLNTIVDYKTRNCIVQYFQIVMTYLCYIEVINFIFKFSILNLHIVYHNNLKLLPNLF